MQSNREPSEGQTRGLIETVYSAFNQRDIQAALAVMTNDVQCYFNLASRNWDALAAYVLSPKLLERRGVPEDLQLVARDRSRSRSSPALVAAPRWCPSNASPEIDEAGIRLDGDWADVSVPRCSGSSPGVDHFGMLYFENRWRFIYTDLFEASPSPETAAR